MRILALLLSMTVSMLTVFAQEPVSTQGDKEIEAIMARVEAREAKPEFTVDVQVEATNDDEKAMLAALERYLGLLAADDVTAIYDMLCDVYRQEVSFSDFAKKDRVSPHSVDVIRAWYDGRCALFRGTMTADTGTSIGVMRIPLKVYVFEEEGAWHIYKNPYEVGGFVNPKGRDVKPPCDFYNKKQEGAH